MEIQAGVLDACHAHRYNMVLAPVGSGRESVASDIRGVFAHHAPDGVVLIPPLTDDPVVLDYLRDNGVPFACVSPHSTAHRIGVTMDEHAAVRDLMAPLIAPGHPRIGPIQAHRPHRERECPPPGYRQTPTHAGINHDPTPEE